MSATFEDQAHQNGYAPIDITPPPAPADVKFGKRDDDVMPHSWACRALTWLHEHHPAVFGDMMLNTMNVNAHTTKTRGK